VPSLAQRRPVVVVTKMDRVRVLRQFPYLRRQPDLSDAESALSGRKLDDTLLKEPAQETLEGLCEHMRWAIAERSSRALLADEFSGFSEDPVPISLDAIVLNPGEAKRLGVMEQLRREQTEVQDDEY
jgi:hypothetical protein